MGEKRKVPKKSKQKRGRKTEGRLKRNRAHKKKGGVPQTDETPADGEPKRAVGVLRPGRTPVYATFMCCWTSKRGVLTSTGRRKKTRARCPQKGAGSLTETQRERSKQKTRRK